MAKANAVKAYVILRREKWDIPAYLGNGHDRGLNLAYLVTEQTPGAPFTLDQAYPFLRDAVVLFGFPDIIFGPQDAFLRLLRRRRSAGAQIVLGVYPAIHPHKMDMVALGPGGRIIDIVIKPRMTELKYTWIIAVWTFAFSRFMHTFLSTQIPVEGENAKELYIGDVIRAAVRSGMTAEAVMFEDETYVDIGTPDDLFAAVEKNIQRLGRCR